MTREEQIKMVADKYCKDEWTHLGFVAGAEWADAHPDIDVRTMAAWRGGHQAAIERACEWLRQANPKQAFVVYKSIQDDALCLDMKFTDEFIAKFRKAMKGD